MSRRHRIILIGDESGSLGLSTPSWICRTLPKPLQSCYGARCHVDFLDSQHFRNMPPSLPSIKFRHWFVSISLLSLQHHTLYYCIGSFFYFDKSSGQLLLPRGRDQGASSCFRILHSCLELQDFHDFFIIFLIIYWNSKILMIFVLLVLNFMISMIFLIIQWYSMIFMVFVIFKWDSMFFYFFRDSHMEFYGFNDFGYSRMHF